MCQAKAPGEEDKLFQDGPLLSTAHSSRTMVHGPKYSIVIKCCQNKREGGGHGHATLHGPPLARA